MTTNRNGKPRQRLAHKKSRTGCTACKQRRVRCGEERPVCRSCLVYGTDCVYLRDAVQVAAASPKEVATDEIKQRLPSLLPATPADPFDVLPVKMTHRSSEAFYYFVRDRNLLSDLTCEGKPSDSRLGLAQTDPTWFQITLCITAAHRTLQRHPDFQETYLLHRQGLLHWLGDYLKYATGIVPASYLSVIGTIIMSDSAFGDDSSVQAHLKGAFSLLDARKRVEKQWRFYDCLKKRLLLMTLFVTYVIQNHQSAKILGCTDFDPVVVSMYIQMGNEFLQAPILAGNPYAATRTDGQILGWLYKAVRELRQNEPCGRDPWAWVRSTGLSPREARLWMRAVSAYALTVGTMDWFGMEQEGDEPSGPAASEELRQLRIWWADLVDAWAAGGRPMTYDIAEQMWQKMKWLESDEGLGVLHEITLQAQWDGLSLEANDQVEHEVGQDNSGLAPEFMYV
ncbi:hypothetical protein GQ53DRAFT_466645 [Thozetella sp. PMI_491]|nr:hypothetical protein GQ53DRAFT_466645 [Thozetella sp. PMI_491]